MTKQDFSAQEPVSSGPDLVLAMTGASGAAYAVGLLKTLCRLGRIVHLVISPSAAQVLRQETGLSVALNSLDPHVFGKISPGRILYHRHEDFNAGIASGSFLTGGMVIVPCSMSTLGAIAHGVTTNLITRAADVHLKERRKLILVPRETPLSQIHLENMLQVTRAGGIILPAMPGWYHRPRHLNDLVDFIVARVCDQLGIPNHLIMRWGASEENQTDENTVISHIADQTGEECLGGEGVVVSSPATRVDEAMRTRDESADDEES
jgi:4-hydroxy-3-polyprenylbenzoate decarboxylase